MKMVQDKKLLQKFKKILRMSKRVKQTHAAKMMKISHDKLLALLFEWGDDLSFKLESDEIVITDSEDFVSEVDALYDDWESKEITGEGKITDINAEITMDPPFEAQNQANPKKKSTHAVKSKKEYRGTELFRAEYAVMEEIEYLLGGKEIPKVDEIKWNTFGFISRDYHA